MFGHKWGRLSLKSVAAARTASAGSSLSIVNLMFATAASLPDARGLGHAIEGDLEPLDRRRTSGADRAGALAPKLAGHFLAGAQLLLVLPEGEAEAVAAGAVDEQESADKAIDLSHRADHRAFALLIRVVGSKVRPVNAEFGTWHHGLIARWWAEFNVATAEEQAYFEAAIRKFGEPALDLACGTGRILMPLIAEGFDVDGADISADMIALAGAAAEKRGFHPRLAVQPMHELDLARTYRTIYMCGSFGLGGRRDYDLEALRRAHRHLEPGGALFITNHNLPYDDDEEGWALWLPGHRTGATSEWPVEGNRRTASDADEIETLFRKDEVDPLQQRT